MNDLIDSLTFFDIPHYAGINPKKVNSGNVAELLEKMKIKSVVEFGNNMSFAKFAAVYRDVYIFGISYELAMEINE